MCLRQHLCLMFAGPFRACAVSSVKSPADRGDVGLNWRSGAELHAAVSFAHDLHLQPAHRDDRLVNRALLGGSPIGACMTDCCVAAGSVTCCSNVDTCCENV